MENLKNVNHAMITQKIGEKLGKLSLGHMTYKQALREVDEIEQLYTKLHGASTNWDSALKRSVAGIRQDTEDFYSRKNQCLENNLDLLTKN